MNLNLASRVRRKIHRIDFLVILLKPINKLVLLTRHATHPTQSLKIALKKLHNRLPYLIKNHPIAQHAKTTLSTFAASSSVRRYLSPKLDIQSFFKTLNKRKVRYVVLRWFEDLPNVEYGEDIDILLHDDDLGLVSDLFTAKPSPYKFDIYTISARCGFAGMPYYPPKIAREILDRRVFFKNLYWVPCTKDYFMSLAYHALYHKGEASGLACALFPAVQCEDHNYEAYLRNLADRLGLGNINLDMDSLHALLSSSGWSPNVDTLRRLARHTDSKWLANLLPKAFNEIEKTGEVICFIAREWATSDRRRIKQIRNFILDKFDILHECEIESRSQNYVLENIRGGEWGCGPYPISGGKPAYAFIAFDYHPALVHDKRRESHPYIQNEHVFIKHKIRDYFNSRMLATKWTNCIHSSDDEVESMDYINIICPEMFDSINQKLDKIRTTYKTDHRVVKMMPSNNTRSKTELIEYKGGLAIKKTFKVGRERFCERERYVYSNYAHKLDSIPPLLESGDNYIIIPYFNDILSEKPTRERFDLIKNYGGKILEAMHTFFSDGFALVNFYPGNILITSKNELKLIDFEFLFQYDVAPDKFINSYDIKGLPNDFKGDMPKGLIPPGITYKNTWEPIFGRKPLEKFL